MTVTSQSRQMMTMRARVLRPTDPGADSWGQEMVGSRPFPMLYDALPCRAWDMRDLGEDMTTDRSIAANMYRMIVPTGSDIAETDVIEDIRDRQGNVLIGGPLRVDSVSWTAGHVCVDLLAINRGLA